MSIINWLIGVPVGILLIGALIGACISIWDYWRPKNKGIAIFFIICLISFLTGIALKIAYYLLWFGKK